MSFLTELCKHLCVAIDPDKYPNMYIKERKTFNKLHRTIPMEWQIDSWSDCDVNGFNTFSTQHESKSAKNNRAIESKISATLNCDDKVTHLYKETNTITYKYIPAPASKYGIVCMKNEQINQEIFFTFLYRKYMSLRWILAKKTNHFYSFQSEFYSNCKSTTNNKSTHHIQMTCICHFVLLISLHDDSTLNLLIIWPRIWSQWKIV